MPDVSEESQAAGARLDQKAAIATLRSMSDEYPQLKQMLPPESPAAAPAPNSAPAPTPNAPKLAPPQSSPSLVRSVEEESLCDRTTVWE